MLPTVTVPNPHGPYSLTLSAGAGSYFFNSSFRASTLIPGEASRSLERADFNEVWRLGSDGKRHPRTLTLSGELIPFNGEPGLRADARALEEAVQLATALIRDNGDGTSRVITLDGARAEIRMISRRHYQATVTLFPTGATVTAGVPPTVPSLQPWVTDLGEQMVTEDGDRLVFFTP